MRYTNRLLQLYYYCGTSGRQDDRPQHHDCTTATLRYAARRQATSTDCRRRITRWHCGCVKLHVLPVQELRHQLHWLSIRQRITYKLAVITWHKALLVKPPRVLHTSTYFELRSSYKLLLSIPCNRIA